MDFRRASFFIGKRLLFALKMLTVYTAMHNSTQSLRITSKQRQRAMAKAEFAAHLKYACAAEVGASDGSSQSRPKEPGCLLKQQKTKDTALGRVLG